MEELFEMRGKIRMHKIMTKKYTKEKNKIEKLEKKK